MSLSAAKKHPRFRNCHFPRSEEKPGQERVDRRIRRPDQPANPWHCPRAHLTIGSSHAAYTVRADLLPQPAGLCYTLPLTSICLTVSMTTRDLHEDLSRGETVVGSTARGCRFVLAALFASPSALAWWNGNTLSLRWFVLAAAILTAALPLPRSRSLVNCVRKRTDLLIRLASTAAHGGSA